MFRQRSRIKELHCLEKKLVWRSAWKSMERWSICRWGLYTIQNPKIESNKVTFTAYDRLASRCNGAYYSKLSYPTDAVDILAEISTMTGVAIDTSTLQRGIQINQRAIIEEGDYNEETDESEVITTYVNPFDGYTYKETIGFIAGLFGKFAICGRTGMIEFRWYQDISYEIPSNIFYNDLQETEESFSIKRLTCDNSDRHFYLDQELPA